MFENCIGQISRTWPIHHISQKRGKRKRHWTQNWRRMPVNRHDLSRSRVFYEAKQYLNEGFATEEELCNFVLAALKRILKSLFLSEEIENVVECLVLSLFRSQSRDEEIGKNIKTNLKYDLETVLREHDPEFKDFHRKLSSSITNFIAYFTLHTIRQHCFATFGVEGDLKIYQRQMYEKAREDSRKKTVECKTTIKSESSRQQSASKPEPVRRENKQVGTSIKQEKKDSSDDDFCEIIEPMPAKKMRLTSTSETKSEEVVKVTDKPPVEFPEKQMLDKLEADEAVGCPIFKTLFRTTVENNNITRHHIRDMTENVKILINDKRNLKMD
ncbi:hypothetical protein L3Y34_001769 [Caenorhabditis briggsae]|uniref:Uncharacterized protein n=2 Tax=Caenorhabditis briggsae TaxID=6238 RepID=A0AAE9DD39_CAEBR|nr:hypothetical protein L3Y34_001769 [Caenorhabditis briggsae]